MDPAIFLDRDGVIIENRDQYVRTWEDVTFYPESLNALARIQKTNYRIVIVTNQSAVGRGILTLANAEEINRRIRQVIVDHGGRVDAFYMCPHAPGDACDCRKPKPGLLIQAARELSIDLPSSIMIGDAIDDLLAGQSAGVSRTILVLSGRGHVQIQNLATSLLRTYEVFPSLAETLQAILP